MRHVEVPFDSDALRANIAGTAQEVVIPDRYLPLVQAVSGFHGVRTDLVRTLAEYFHTFRNLEHVIEGFQTTLLRNWTYFERSEERAYLFELLSELVLGLFNTPLSDDQASRLLRQLASWCIMVLDGPFADSYEPSMHAVGACVAQVLTDQPRAALERDVLLRDLVQLATRIPSLEVEFSRFYRDLLGVGYERLRDRLALVQWAHSSEAELITPEKVTDSFAMLEPARISSLEDTAKSASISELLSAKLPLFSDIIDQAVDALFLIDELEDRFSVSLYLLKDDTLGYRQSEVIAHLLGVVKQLMEPSRGGDAERILSRLTRFFRTHDDEFLLMRFQCYETIGVAIGQVGNVRAADHLIEDALSWEFQCPDIRGATDDWATVVNPYHVPNIRCWMTIIESNPALYERLAAALNVHLRLGGVHVSDTDVFQRDVTRFLNADIRPIYFVAKQLLRTFPVYFSEVGAEGELRAASTELDEICGRKDTLMHFLRKQSHAESSNRLVAFSRTVLSYWTTLDPTLAQPYLSEMAAAAVVRERMWAEQPHRVLAGLWQRLGVKGSIDAASDSDVALFLDRLVALPPSALQDLLQKQADESDDVSTGPRRVALMVRTHQLLAHKYSPSADDVGASVSDHRTLPSAVRQEFCDALGGWGVDRSPATRDRLLDAALGVLEHLKEVVLDPAPSTAVENFYQKRHIAAGIPSMYGTYSETKLDALGLSFRVEQLVELLLEDLVVHDIETYVNRHSLRNMAVTIRRFERALAVDGIDSHSLSANLRLLESSLGSYSFTFHQYQNVFQFIVGSVTEVARMSVLSHDQSLRTILQREPPSCAVRSVSADAAAEMVIREVLVTALGMQALDRYVAMASRRISMLAGRLSGKGLTRMMNYDPERLISPLHMPRPDTDDQRTLGFKGLGLKQMASYGHNVPQGFILTTELFRARPAFSYRPLYADAVERIRRALGGLELQTGLRLDDPGCLLTLSVRSGAAISMPGSMATLVDVGLNDVLAETLSEKPGFEWAAWDSYRRFLQSWAMTAGVSRDFFDAIINEFKVSHGVERKLDFEPGHMRDLAYAYRAGAEDLGVRFLDDPFDQVIACVTKVLESWDSPEAVLYREYLGIAQEWGTAVIVQRMVFGNLNKQSGSGVVFTHDPLDPTSRQVRLFGDFAIQCQGDDLVGGLVYPLPISETQRLGGSSYRGVEGSLESQFPDVYQALLHVARDLVDVREFDPQEIEFTFESASQDGLYILQKRAMVQHQVGQRPRFDTSSPHFQRAIAEGTGVSGGAYAGRVAITDAHIEQLLENHPEEDILLLRPDTVPEDITMIAKVSGMLTARGGATSHAAVTAKRLGKAAVVDCRALEVDEHRGVAVIAGKRVEVGEWLSIDGRTGNIFRGKVPIVTS
ncbi:MAG: PEP/pyruvate-binding domain-containing protein [Coriobacteriia bacterium]|jgi:pyruvate,orthophosphate dikinase|nr:PEP/pyruvate-binding domain-containing protein [Coriobacteriia bacterium]